jgi:hypothetical protein
MKLSIEPLLSFDRGLLLDLTCAVACAARMSAGAMAAATRRLCGEQHRVHRRADDQRGREATQARELVGDVLSRTRANRRERPPCIDKLGSLVRAQYRPSKKTCKTALLVARRDNVLSHGALEWRV